MTITPEEGAAIQERAAQILADRLYSELLANYCELSRVQLIPVSLAASILGVSSSHARRILPVVDTGMRPGGVTWEDLMELISKRKKNL